MLLQPSIFHFSVFFIILANKTVVCLWKHCRQFFFIVGGGSHHAPSIRFSDLIKMSKNYFLALVVLNWRQAFSLSSLHVVRESRAYGLLSRDIQSELQLALWSTA